MAIQNEVKGSGSVAGSVNKPQVGGKPVTRERKQYDHDMSDSERFALQTVQRAQAALKVVNEAIKSGKTINPALVDLCFDLSKAVGSMLFAKA
jgi:hypothetical protein